MLKVHSVYNKAGFELIPVCVGHPLHAGAVSVFRSYLAGIVPIL